MFAGSGFAAEGEVRALGAEIGQLDLSGATLTNPGQDALSLDGATIRGGVFMRDGCVVKGEVRAVRAEIGAELDLWGATLTNPGQDALNLDGVTIDGAMLVDAGCAIDGRLCLTFTRIGVLQTGRAPVGRPDATGWQLADVHGPLTDWRTARAWLDTAPSGTAFAASAWHELPKVYDRQGRPSNAKRLRIAAARRITRNSSWPVAILRTLYALFAGYGYWPLLAAVWLVGAILGAAAVVYFNPWAFETVDAIQQAIGLSPWLYGTATVLPAVTIAGLDKWIITESWVAMSLIGLKLFGWLQTGILLAGLTGLLKKA